MYASAPGRRSIACPPAARQGRRPRPQPSLLPLLQVAHARQDELAEWQLAPASKDPRRSSLSRAERQPGLLSWSPSAVGRSQKLLPLLRESARRKLSPAPLHVHRVPSNNSSSSSWRSSRQRSREVLNSRRQQLLITPPVLRALPTRLTLLPPLLAVIGMERVTCRRPARKRPDAARLHPDAARHLAAAAVLAPAVRPRRGPAHTLLAAKPALPRRPRSAAA